MRQRGIRAGSRSFALVDAYMGGKFARELTKLVLTPLIREFGVGTIKFNIFWLRETYGFESIDTPDGLIKQQGTIKKGSPYAQDISVHTIPLTIVLGDDMNMIIEDINSSKPIRIFDEDGDIIHTYTPGPDETSRTLLIKLLKS